MVLLGLRAWFNGFGIWVFLLFFLSCIGAFGLKDLVEIVHLEIFPTLTRGSSFHTTRAIVLVTQIVEEVK